MERLLLIFNAQETRRINQRKPDSILIRKQGPEISRQPACMAGLVQKPGVL